MHLRVMGLAPATVLAAGELDRGFGAAHFLANARAAKLDRVQRYKDRSRAEARLVTTPDLGGGRSA